MKTARLLPPACARRMALGALGRIAVGAAAFAGPAASAGRLRLAGRSMAAETTLPRPHAWRALLREAAADGHPVVVLFSTPGCAYCRFVRHDHLRHLAAATPQGSGVRVVELSLDDRRPLDPEVAAGPASPSALAASLGIRFAPTVVFFGPDGELAERLVGYQSADFYGAYLEQRIATAIAALRQARSKTIAEG